MKIVEVKYWKTKRIWTVSTAPLLGFETQRSAINFALNMRYDLLVVYNKSGKKYEMYAKDPSKF